MPNYNYKCANCLVIEKKFLAISTDPSKQFPCEKCCGFMDRVPITPGPVTGLKTFAGDWFKKTYGHEIGGDGESAAQQKADIDAAIKAHQREN